MLPQTQSTTLGITFNRQALMVVLVMVFLSIAGYGIMIPVAPYLVARYVSDPTRIGITVGLLTTLYAVCQFLAAPGLGAISDRFGRRPILLLCLLGSAGGFLLLGIGGALWVLFLGRIIDGLTGANSSVIMAYVADITPSQTRGKYFGFIGALEGLGLVLGPTVGGLLARFSIEMPFYVAAAVAFASFIVGLLFLPESLPKATRASSITVAALNPLRALWDVFTIRHLRWLLVAIFLFMLPGYMVQSNLGLFAKDSMFWNADAVGVLFTIFGIASVLVQAVLLQWLLKHVGAMQLSIVGLCLAVIALLLIVPVALVRSTPLFYSVMILLALGDGLTSPNLPALISQGADERSQGKVQGGNKSMQSLAAITGPLVAGALYDHVGYSSPYVAGAGLFVLTIGAILLARPVLHRVIEASAQES
jgi:DHA1 family tetracycline resistance protein-like MFS transporter